jgi:hypothetical protein
MGRTTYKRRLLDVRQDRLDLRDRVYQPVLKSLPANYPNSNYVDNILACYRRENLILDQGENGACSGYALASVINYLLLERQDEKKRKSIEPVSSKMLFNLARIYDEWDGEDYEGSSCRGAMKGWHKHGVCADSYWLFNQEEPTEGWEENSIEKPLGAYYRVNKDSISDIQSALCEVGALYVSAAIHDGWWRLNNIKDRAIKDIEKDFPKIEYDNFSIGNHAFVIIGYNRQGFIIQNSWGKSWGNCGFAILSYQEWLTNGLDVWVAVMGVPIDIEHTSHTITSHSLSSSSHVEQQKKHLEKNSTEERAYNHTLILNANGRAKHTIINTSTLERSIEIISYENLKKWMEESSENRKVLIYAMGGLESEKRSIKKIEQLIPYFLNNGIYPIFLTWQQSYQEVIENSIEDFLKKILEGKDKKVEAEINQNKVALERAIENHCKKISTRGVWVEMKEQSRNTLQKKLKGFRGERSGVLYLLTKALKTLSVNVENRLEIHAMAHSAGAELLTTSWLKRLEQEELTLSSMHLLSPTVSIQDSNEFMIKAYKNGLFKKRDIHIYMLSKEMEQADNVGHYNKSLLYLISRSLEKIHKTPLLGLMDSWDEQNIKTKDGIFNTLQLNELKKWQAFAYTKKDTLSPYQLGKEMSQLTCSKESDFVKLSHSTLDRSTFILERILKIITTGSEEGKLLYEVTYLC